MNDIIMRHYSLCCVEILSKLVRQKGRSLRNFTNQQKKSILSNFLRPVYILKENEKLPCTTRKAVEKEYSSIIDKMYRKMKGRQTNYRFHVRIFLKFRLGSEILVHSFWKSPLYTPHPSDFRKENQKTARKFKLHLCINFPIATTTSRTTQHTHFTMTKTLLFTLTLLALSQAIERISLVRYTFSNSNCEGNPTEARATAMNVCFPPDQGFPGFTFISIGVDLASFTIYNNSQCVGANFAQNTAVLGTCYNGTRYQTTQYISPVPTSNDLAVQTFGGSGCKYSPSL